MLHNNTCVSEKQIVIHTKNHTNQVVTYRSQGTTSYATFLRKPLKPRNDHPSITRNINKTGSHNPDPETKLKQSRSLTVIEPRY